MGTFCDRITDQQADLIRNSHMFFIASVDPGFRERGNGPGPVNLSPKGGSPLHVLSSNKVAYLDYAGSGKETAVHIAKGGSITLMIMSGDEKDAAIVRLYGKGSVHKLDDYEFAERLMTSPARHLSGPRQVIEIDVEKTQTSCGYGVPALKFIRQRTREDRGGRYKG